MNKDQTTTISRTEITPTDKISPWIWAVILTVIFLVLIGSFLIYWFLFRNPSPPKISTCSGQTCLNGQYCNSLGQCVSGTGEIPGDSCCKNTDCIYGYKCVSSYCLSNNSTPADNLPPQFNLSIIWGAVTYYLDPANSQMTQIPPTTSFSYDYINQILTLNKSTGNNQVSPTLTGNLAVAKIPYPLTLINYQNNIQIRHPCGSTLSYNSPKLSSQTIPVYFPATSEIIPQGLVPEKQVGICPDTFQKVIAPIILNFTVTPVTS